MMNKENKVQDLHSDCPVGAVGRKDAAARKAFAGYTLEELRIRKVVNELKINAAKEQIALFVSPQVQGEVKTFSNCIKSFDTAIKYFDIAMLAYGISRRVSSFFGRFSRKR